MCYKKEELEILGMVSIFNYQFEAGQEAFKRAEIDLVSLTRLFNLTSIS